MKIIFLTLLIFLAGCSSKDDIENVFKICTSTPIENAVKICTSTPEVTFNINYWFGNSVSIKCEVELNK